MLLLPKFYGQSTKSFASKKRQDLAIFAQDPFEYFNTFSWNLILVVSSCQLCLDLDWRAFTFTCRSVYVNNNRSKKKKERGCRQRNSRGDINNANTKKRKKNRKSNGGNAASIDNKGKEQKRRKKPGRNLSTPCCGARPSRLGRRRLSYEKRLEREARAQLNKRHTLPCYYHTFIDSHCYRLRHTFL